MEPPGAQLWPNHYQSPFSNTVDSQLFIDKWFNLYTLLLLLTLSLPSLCQLPFGSPH